MSLLSIVCVQNIGRGYVTVGVTCGCLSAGACLGSVARRGGGVFFLVVLASGEARGIFYFGSGLARGFDWSKAILESRGS